MRLLPTPAIQLRSTSPILTTFGTPRSTIKLSTTFWSQCRPLMSLRSMSKNIWPIGEIGSKQTYASGSRRHVVRRFDPSAGCWVRAHSSCGVSDFK